jgi:hypothetical protein
MKYSKLLFVLCITIVYISLTTAVPILRHRSHTTRSRELQRLIEDTLLEIGQENAMHSEAAPAATGTAAVAATATAGTKPANGTDSSSPIKAASQSNSNTQNQNISASTKLAEDKVKGITKAAEDKADKATLEATNKIVEKVFKTPKENFGDFKGDASNLFDHDEELKYNIGKNPLMAVDEAEIKNKDIQQNPTGGSDNAATGGRSVGTTGATGNANSATGNANSGVVGSSTGGAQ